jgi:hypothetical protein
METKRKGSSWWNERRAPHTVTAAAQKFQPIIAGGVSVGTSARETDDRHFRGGL